MDKKDSIISAEKIFKVIYNFEGKSNTLGKTVTIFIGVSQSGKTTTINALRGAKYQIKEDETIIITNKSFNNAGITGGRDGASCTIFPTVYDTDNSSYSYLDGQGHGDTHTLFKVNNDIFLNSNEIQITGSILMEMAVKKAKNISVVMVINYQKFLGGIKYLQEEGEMLERLFMSINEYIPIFILFNRFSTSCPSEMRKYLSLNGDEKIDYLHKKIKDQAEEIQKAKKDQKNMKCFDIIYNNINNNNFGFIDIEDDNTISFLKNKFQHLDPFPKEKIAIDNSSMIRADFNEICRKKLIESYKLIILSNIKLAYPLDFLKNVIEKADKSLLDLNNIMDQIIYGKNCDKKNIKYYFDREIANNKEEIQKLEKKITKCQVEQNLCDINMITIKSKLEILNHDKENIIKSINNIDDFIIMIKNKYESKQSALYDDMKYFESEITNKKLQIARKQYSLNEFWQPYKDPIFTDRGNGNGYFHYFKNIRHIPHNVKVKPSKNTKYSIMHDSELFIEINFRNESIFSQNFSFTVEYYGYKKDSEEYKPDFDRIISQISDLRKELESLENRKNQIDDRKKSEYHDYDILIKEKNAEKQNKQQELHSIEEDINRYNIELKQEDMKLENIKKEIDKFENQKINIRGKLIQLSQENQMIIYILPKIEYFEDIKKKINEKNKIISDFPNYTNLPNEIQSYINISRKLSVNEKELMMIEKEHEKLQLQKSSSIYSVELINTNDSKINPSLPQDLIFIEKSTKKKISFYTFIEKLNNEITK